MLLLLVTDLDVIHVMLTLQASTRHVGPQRHPNISKESLGGQSLCSKIRVPARSHQENNT